MYQSIIPLYDSHKIICKLNINKSDSIFAYIYSTALYKPELRFQPHSEQPNQPSSDFNQTAKWVKVLWVLDIPFTDSSGRGASENLAIV